MSLPAADRAGVGTWGVATALLCGTLLAELIKDHPPWDILPRECTHGAVPRCVGPAGGFESIHQNLTVLDAALDASRAV